jgi:5-hydroxyisourate hydrolase-like protein (transthyretin family)
MAITIFALVLTNTLGRVVDVAKVDAALLKRAVEGAPAERGIPDEPATMTGSVTQLSSGEPVSGATVELFKADDPLAPVKSSATGPDGGYELKDLFDGTYKVRFRGAGFVELWFGGATTFEDADEVEVKIGETTADINMQIGSLPGSIAGLVLADDPADVTVTLQIPAAALDSVADAQIQQVVTDATGAFLLEKVAAPASYEIVVSKSGYTTVTRVVNLAASEDQEGIEIRLRRGDGLIGGVVTDADGVLLGGASIVATNTVDQVSTISLTTGDVGAFNLRNLPTPATYTITFSKDGYASQNLTIALEDAEQLTGLSVELAQGTGSISGAVQLDGEGPLGGVLVTVSNSETTVSTETLSVGSVGSYILSNLPVPGTYTVTFSGTGLASQVRSVDLDAGGSINRTGLDATLTEATAVVSGTVTDPDGEAAGVAVELSDGTTILNTFSANDPEGEYVLAGIPPGTYTLTFRQTGAVPRSVLVTLAAGESRTVDVELEPQATIAGTVTRTDGSGSEPLQGAQVTAYRVAEFPNVVAATTLTDEDGDYVLTDLTAPDEYIIEFAYPEGALAQDSVRVVLDAGEIEDDIDAELTLAGDE